MTRTSFGKTWWGAQWLQALAHIDHDNRLPRGRAYAGKGAVLKMAIDGGSITAQVQGSRPRPYAVTIEVPELKPKESTALLDGLARDPAVIARLLNRQLDPAVLEAAQALGIRVFPERWKDLRMKCSCPDEAVPCKHLAAVVYLLSQEIDGDPFLVFSLRGLDLAAALRSRDIEIEPALNATLPPLMALLNDGAPSLAGPGDPAVLEALDFSALPDLTPTLWQLLPAHPSFVGSGDFRSSVQLAVSRVAKFARQQLDAMPGDAPDRFDAQDRPQLRLDRDGQVTVTGLLSPQASHLAELTARLGAIPSHRLAELQPQTVALQAMSLLAWHLWAQGAVVPQVHARSDGAIGLRWLPAMLDPSVAQLMARMAEALPGELLLMPADKGRKKPASLSPAAQASALCGLFLDHHVRLWSAAERGKVPVGDVAALFFSTLSARFDGPGEAAIPASIQNWLARLHVTRQEHTLVMRLDDETAGTAFALTLAVDRRSAPLDVPAALSAVLANASWATARLEVLRQVSVLAEFFPPLADHVRAGATEPMLLDSAALAGFLFDTLPALRLLGIRALLPKALDQLLRPRVSMQVKSRSSSAGSGLLTADAVLGFDWKVALGDQLLTRAEFERLVKKATGIVRFKGEYIYLDPAEIERLRAQLQKPPEPDAAELLRVALAGEYDGAPVRLDARAQALVQSLLDAGELPLPKGLQAQLRPYQARGYAWLYRNARIGLGSVIADDMGLGKTLQVIATLQKLKEDGALQDGSALIVVPTSLLTNWQKELARFAPDLRVAVFHGSKRELGAARPELLLTTYGMVRSEATKLKAVPWALVIADEAQNLKNPSAAQTRAIKSLPARSHIAMSGTPVENRLLEFWSLMDFVNRGYLGGPTHFGKAYAVPIQTHRNLQVLDRFKRVTAPFLMRRMKSDKQIISDLPDKIEQDQFCALTPAQTALYESVVQEGLKAIEGASTAFKQQGLVLQLMLALKQVCNHPAHYLKQGAQEAELSGKAMRLLELIDAVHASGEKALVFTQFREMGELLCDLLARRHGQRPAFLHGGVGRAQRDAMVERFQTDRTERVFVLSLKAGGTGLNLTEASHVIHYDLWWNPAVEAQATDRAYRIGQKRKVQVHRFITRATFEERINEMMQRKRELADLTVGSGEQWVGQLPPEELRALFALT